MSSLDAVECTLIVEEIAASLRRHAESIADAGVPRDVFVQQCLTKVRQLGRVPSPSGNSNAETDLILEVEDARNVLKEAAARIQAVQALVDTPIAVSVLQEKSVAALEPLFFAATENKLPPRAHHASCQNTKKYGADAADPLVDPTTEPHFFDGCGTPGDLFDWLKSLTFRRLDAFRLCPACDQITSTLTDHVRSRAGEARSAEDAEAHTNVVVEQCAVPTVEDIERKCRNQLKRVRALYPAEDPAPMVELCAKKGYAWDPALWASVTDQHILAVYLYSLETEIYADMNWAMRSFTKDGADEAVDDAVQRYRTLMRVLSDALALLPRVPSKQLYRGLDCRLDRKLYSDGNTILMKAFTSTTASADVVKSFISQNPGEDTQGTIFLMRPKEFQMSSRGSVVSMFSEFVDEDEVLFRENFWVEVRQTVGLGAKEVLRAHIGIDLTPVDMYELVEIDAETAQAHQEERRLLEETRASHAASAVALALRSRRVAEAKAGLDKCQPEVIKKVLLAPLDADDKKNILHYIAEKDWADAMELILPHCDAELLLSRDDAGMTPLMVNLDNSTSSVAKLLIPLMSPEDLLAVDDSNMNALHLACQNEEVNDVAVQLLTILDTQGIRAHDDSKMNILHYICMSGDLDTLLAALPHFEEKHWTAKDDNKTTPLLHACSNRKKEGIALHLIPLCPKKTLTEFGYGKITPLMDAANSGMLRVVEALLPHYDKTALHASDEDRMHALHYAVNSNNPEIAKVLLKVFDDKAVFARTKEKDTVLHYAADSGSAELLEIFLSLPLCTEDLVNSKGCDEATPLHLVMKKIRPDALGVLLPRVDAKIWELKDSELKTPKDYFKKWKSSNLEAYEKYKGLIPG